MATFFNPAKGLPLIMDCVIFAT